MPEFVQMVTLSTAHITKEARDWLDEQSKLTENNKMKLITYPKGEYGWFIPLHEDMFEEQKIIPESLLIILGYAWGAGCQWIMFDNEIEEIDDLPKYDW